MAAMEPAEYRPDDTYRDSMTTGCPRAAMEPAEYRPDDDAPRTQESSHGNAAMEPAEYRPDDLLNTSIATEDGVYAAMEPAEYRPDDISVTSPAGVARRPQWSRPSIGRMTFHPL